MTQLGTEDQAQRLRKLAALADDPESVSSTHIIWQFTTMYSSRFRGSDAFSAPCMNYMYLVHIREY